MRHVIYGPPGTGKTTRLTEILRNESGRIGFVSFTRAAVHEAADRLGIDRDAKLDSDGWCHTLHAVAFRLLGGEDLIEHEDIQSFANQFAYNLSGNAIDDEPTADDELRSVYEWSRAALVDLDTAVRCGPFAVPLAEARRYKARYEEFKRSKRKSDFGDLLTSALELRLRPAIDVLVVDEAQDLSPVQIAYAKVLARNCDRIYIAGDDDQSIYTFGGADPTWLVGLAARAERVDVLAQSHRVPRAVYNVAAKIGDRIGNRVAKEYRPRDADGEVAWIEEEQIAGSLSSGTMVLGRTRKQLRRLARDLGARGIAFSSPVPGLSPLDGDGADAVRIAIDLLAGRVVRPRTFDELLKFVPCGVLAPRGTKAEAKRRQVGVRLSDLSDMGLATLGEHLRMEGPVALPKLTGWQRDALSRMVRRHGCLPIPEIELSTIHRSKGREANTVVVLGDWGGHPSAALASPRAAIRDCEHRVAYVAATRARECLVLARGRQPSRSYPWPRRRV